MQRYAIIEDGAVVQVTTIRDGDTETVQQLGAIPCPDWVGCGDLWDGKSFSPAVISLAPLKADKDQEINAARLAANTSTFTYAGKQFACDALSRGDIDGTNGCILLTGAFPPNWPGAWKAVDNTYVAIATIDDWKAFYLAMCATGADNFARAQKLKAQLAAAATPQDIAAITW